MSSATSVFASPVEARWWTMTAAPAACSRRTIVAPTRFAPPVTSATFPDRDSAMRSIEDSTGMAHYDCPP
ncbi:MAG: hypothetical protein M5U08_19170 [Burkholderiales bacterium]|nr:hypothetical protein [Burkholderiales bacterium]